MSVQYSQLCPCFSDLSHVCSSHWSVRDLGGGLLIFSVFKDYIMLIGIRFIPSQVERELRAHEQLCGDIFLRIGREKEKTVEFRLPTWQQGSMGQRVIVPSRVFAPGRVPFLVYFSVVAVHPPQKA